MRTSTVLSRILTHILIAVPSTTALHPREPSPGYSVYVPPTYPGAYYDPLPKTRAAPPLPTHTTAPLRRKIGETHTNITLIPLRYYPNATDNLNEAGGCAFDAPNPDDYYMNDARGDMKVSLRGVDSVALSNEAWRNYCGTKIRITGPDGRQCEANIVSGCGACTEWGLGLMRKPWEAVGDGEKDVAWLPEASWEVIG